MEVRPGEVGGDVRHAVPNKVQIPARDPTMKAGQGLGDRLDLVGHQYHALRFWGNSQVQTKMFRVPSVPSYDLAFLLGAVCAACLRDARHLSSTASKAAMRGSDGGAEIFATAMAIRFCLLSWATVAR